jgi:hypothetical protein
VVTDFEPTTDFPESIDQGDADAIASAAQQRDASIQRKRRLALAAMSIISAIVLMAFGFDFFRVLVAVTAGYLLLRIGMAILGSFARPIPEPPAPGQLRKVKLTYRCTSCGTELRMTRANDQVPQAPRHCADEMELTTAIEDL